MKYSANLPLQHLQHFIAFSLQQAKGCVWQTSYGKPLVSLSTKSINVECTVKVDKTSYAIENEEIWASLKPDVYSHFLYYTLSHGWQQKIAVNWLLTMQMSWNGKHSMTWHSIGHNPKVYQKPPKKIKNRKYLPINLRCRIFDVLQQKIIIIVAFATFSSADDRLASAWYRPSLHEPSMESRNILMWSLLLLSFLASHERSTEWLKGSQKNCKTTTVNSFDYF